MGAMDAGADSRRGSWEGAIGPQWRDRDQRVCAPGDRLGSVLTASGLPLATEETPRRLACTLGAIGAPVPAAAGPYHRRFWQPPVPATAGDKPSRPGNPMPRWAPYRAPLVGSVLQSIVGKELLQSMVFCKANVGRQVL